MGNNTVSILAMVVLLAILAGLITCTAIKYKDNFDDVGGLLTKPPSWWSPTKYNESDWMTTYYPDMGAQAGPQGNFYSSAYRFWPGVRQDGGWNCNPRLSWCPKNYI